MSEKIFSLTSLKNPRVAIGIGLIGVLVISAISYPLLPLPQPNEQRFEAMFQPPSLEHPLGTDQFGRSMLSRILFGARFAFIIGIVAVGLQMIIGIFLGLLAGFYRGIIGEVIMRITDMMLAIPAMVLALAIAGFLGGGIRNVIIAVGIIGWRGFARLTRSEVLSIREEPYIEAARAMGGSDLHIMVRHVLRNCISSLIVYTTLQIPIAILWSAGLSFLGLGAQPPTPEWGAMAAAGRNFLTQAWWITTFSGMAIMLTVLAFNLLGDGLRDILDPNIDNVS